VTLLTPMRVRFSDGSVGLVFEEEVDTSSLMELEGPTNRPR
jgi:hypothetical protein